MSFHLVAQTPQTTVLTEYNPEKRQATSYQSEADLENEFLKLLQEQGYEYLPIHCEEDLIINLRRNLEALNHYTFTDSEWDRFFHQNIANSNDSIESKTQRIQEDFIQAFEDDQGKTHNIKLIDKTNLPHNRLQVINQYGVGQKEGAKHDNRYDVTILVNGLPLVHIELKRRGVQLRQAFNQIERYQRESFWAQSGLFNYVQIFVISNGTETKYYSNTTRYNVTQENRKKGQGAKTSNSFVFTSYWADANNKNIPDLVDFTKTFFARHTLLSILTKYCVFTSEKMLMVMRPYQITATERILNRIEMANSYKKYGSVEGGGYIWHTTGSGKTLTSFKTALLATSLPYIDKVLFVVDRKDLDYQTIKEYDRFKKGAANSNTSTAILKEQLEDPNAKIIITTIQKLSSFIKKNKHHSVYNQHLVFIFDECHRSQFGEMHQSIIKNFKKYHLFGFTGTPIFAANASGSGAKTPFLTTQQAFGSQLHAYTIVNAIHDKNVLPFHVEYHKTMKGDDEIEDEEVWDINRSKVLIDPERISLITEYILKAFPQKTYQNDKAYAIRSLTNIAESIEKDKKKKNTTEKWEKRTQKGFNSILAVSSIPMAIAYYQEFQNQMKRSKDPRKKLKVAMIYSYGANEAEEASGLSEENSEDTINLDKSSREWLETAIQDYNQMFHTNYDTSSEKFQNYYKDVSARMKNKEIDVLIVVNMFLTGFDATTLNTLWVDKHLKMHGLIQAFSRTNRILNSVKQFGNIVCFRNLQKEVDEALALFGDKDAGGIVLLPSFQELYFGYTDSNGKEHLGYLEQIQILLSQFPLSEQIFGEKRKKDFITLFGAILRLRNILASFDEFDENEAISLRDFQDYLSYYNDLKDEWNEEKKRGALADIDDDIVFEIELLRQIDVNIDYILTLVKQYHESHEKDKELLITIQKTIDSSPELRSKKELIEAFLKKLGEVSDVYVQWKEFVFEEKEKDLKALIAEEKLKSEETRRFLEASFQNGEIKTIGTDLNKIMPPISRFRKGKTEGREVKKQHIIDRLQTFFHKYYGAI